MESDYNPEAHHLIVAAAVSHNCHHCFDHRHNLYKEQAGLHRSSIHPAFHWFLPDSMSRVRLYGSNNLGVAAAPEGTDLFSQKNKHIK